MRKMKLRHYKLSQSDTVKLVEDYDAKLQEESSTGKENRDPTPSLNGTPRKADSMANVALERTKERFASMHIRISTRNRLNLVPRRAHGLIGIVAREVSEQRLANSRSVLNVTSAENLDISHVNVKVSQQQKVHQRVDRMQKHFQPIRHFSCFMTFSS